MIPLAALLLAPLFADHAVVQQDKPIPVWGSAAAGEKVTVTLGDRSGAAIAGADGDWIAYLPPLSPQPGGIVLKVQGAHETITRRDLLVGEVWLLAGAARLDFPPPAAGNPVRALATDPESADPVSLPVRVFRFANRPPTPRVGAPPFAESEWSSAGASGGFGAAGGTFAAELALQVQCPIGIIDCTAEGGALPAWLSPMGASHWAGEGAGRAPGPRAVRPDQSGGAPSFLYAQRIEPVARAGLRGILWCPGEEDVASAAGYRSGLEALIASWRAHFGEASLPFYWLQLPARGGKDRWERRAILRWQQTLALEVPSTAQAITYDLTAGAEGADACRREAGRRLALLAKAGVYGVAEDASGPVPSGTEVFPGSIRVHFRWADNGLIAIGKPPQGFEIAGEDARFVPALATLAGATVIVRAAQVPHPVAVRYGWRSTPEPNLFNGAGLPAGPFTTE